jgi:predicted nucleic acid-binding protein
MRLLVDTNVLVYESFEDSERHVEASEIIYSNEVYIPTIVLHEYIWLLTRHFQIAAAQVALKLEQLLSEKNIHIICEEASDLTYALRLLNEDGAKPSDVNDYIILATALNRDLHLATYDKQLRKAGAKRGLPLIPPAV